MATTTNYGWETPDDTDLVKDGASAIRTLGSSIDTTTKALNPETTLGDISYRSSTANTNTRLAIGTAGQVLKVNSGGTAPEWGSVSGGFNLIGSTTFSASSAADFDNIFTSSYDTYLVVGEDITASTSGSYVGLQFRYGTSTQNSTCYGVNFGYNITNTLTTNGQNNTAAFVICRVNSASDFASFHFFVNQVGNTSEKAKFRGQFTDVEGNVSGVCSGFVNTDRTYTGLRFLPHPTVGGGNPISGKITVYGLAK